MIYSVRHKTTYRYDIEVGYARCSLRLVPRPSSSQTLLQSDIVIQPGPAFRTAQHDKFSNPSMGVVITTPHLELVVESFCLVDVFALPPSDPAHSLRWEIVRASGLEHQSLHADGPALFLHPTRATPYVPAIAEFARESFQPGRPVLVAAGQLSHRLKTGFVYDPSATEVHTPVQTAFEQRRGVCQDFAHIMICALRGLGLPARYVMGYIRTLPAPGQPRLEGADATHAWVELWCGQSLGWVGIDPTNDMFTGDEHIVLAIGRDYRDVAPIEGLLLGAGRQTLEVEVDVQEQGDGLRPGIELARSSA